MRRRLQWDDAPREPPRRPYRDTALVYLGFALVIVLVSVVTGGGLVRAVVVAGLFWLVATTYGWLRWRRRLQGEDRRT